MVRTIHVDEVVPAVAELCISANYDLNEDTIQSLKQGMEHEESSTGVAVLRQILDNAAIATEERLPMCQDTGTAVFFVEVGQDVHLEGGSLYDAINEGVRQGYKEGYLRKSICDPFTRKNTGDNTPAIVHYDVVPGDRLKITMAAKGGGSENMSSVVMLKPSDGRQGLINYIVKRAAEMGPNPCPPIVIGIGIGGNFEKAALLAKKAILRPLGEKNPDPELAALEEEILKKTNALGIGPQGMGGRTFALGVHILKHPCHIASMPLGVNIQCHANRHKDVVL
ncbi:MAG: fumarate hydratase [Candidatus Tectomicrobia bacterium]|nr:fumarate hydratase [Candidatus Tectomicrobia bacterium]